MQKIKSHFLPKVSRFFKNLPDLNSFRSDKFLKKRGNILPKNAFGEKITHTTDQKTVEISFLTSRQDFVET